jgi:hypothetical protein
MKIKTLKDFNIEDYQGEYCFKANSLKKDLKQEAIKRVKYYLTKIPKFKILKINKDRKFGDRIKWTSPDINFDSIYLGAIEEIVSFYDLTMEEII